MYVLLEDCESDIEILFWDGTVTVLAFVLEDDSGTKMIQKEIMPLMVMDKVRHTVTKYIPVYM